MNVNWLVVSSRWGHFNDKMRHCCVKEVNIYGLHKINVTAFMFASLVFDVLCQFMRSDRNTRSTRVDLGFRHQQLLPKKLQNGVGYMLIEIAYFKDLQKVDCVPHF